MGWYRKVVRSEELKVKSEELKVKSEELDHYYLQFDGIFRNAQVWFNGFYLGSEPSGYATHRCMT